MSIDDRAGRRWGMLIALPTADRRQTFDFYTGALDFDAFGPLADDGVPEPLRFEVAGTQLMFVPTGGFGWVTGGRPTAKPDVSECLLGLTVDSDQEVDDILARVAAAGAEVVAPARQQVWGYCGVFADPDGHLWQVTTTPPAPR